MFGIIGKRRRELDRVYTLVSRLELEKEALEKAAREYNRAALEGILIGYCRVFGKRIEIDGAEDMEKEYLENAILFNEPFIQRHRSRLIGICYNPEFDTYTDGAKKALLRGRHMGLEGIISTSYLCGDEAEYQGWDEIGEAVLEILKEQFKDAVPPSD